MVHFGVVETVQQMDRARPGSGQAHADFAREFRVTARHECRHFLVARLNEFDAMRIFLSALQRAHDAVYSISGVSENPFYSPLVKPFDQEIGARVAHKGGYS
jgi:hypothetical protein